MSINNPTIDPVTGEVKTISNTSGTRTNPVRTGAGSPIPRPSTANSNTYDFGDWLPSIAAGVTQPSVGFQSVRPFNLRAIAAQCVATGCTLNVYFGTTNAAIVVTHNANGTWTVKVNDPTTGANISTWTSGAGNSATAIFLNSMFF